MPRCKPSSRRCRTGSKASAVAWMRSSNASSQNVYKAVEWNTPFYGFEGKGWFLGFHCMTKYVKVAFFRGTSLRPIPPVESKQKEVRYFHIHEDDQFDEAQLADWVKQASRLPSKIRFAGTRQDHESSLSRRCQQVFEPR